MKQTYKRGELTQQTAIFLGRTLKARNLTQEAFAEMVPCSTRTAQRWLKDGVSSLDTLQSICNVLKVSVGDIFLEEEDVPLFVSAEFPAAFKLAAS